MKKPTGVKRGETRAALIAAGHEIFAASPVDAVAIDDIVAVAGVSKGSFYNHFMEKVDLLHVVRDDIRREIQVGVQKANLGEDDAAVRVARALCVYFRFVLDQPRYVSILLQFDPDGSNSISEGMHRGAVEDARLGITSGRFSVGSAESAAAFVIGVGYAGLVNMLSDQNVSSIASLGRHLVTMVLRGLGLTTEEASKISAATVQQIVRGTTTN